MVFLQGFHDGDSIWLIKKGVIFIKIQQNDISIFLGKDHEWSITSQTSKFLMRVVDIHQFIREIDGNVAGVMKFHFSPEELPIDIENCEIN